MSSSQVEPPFVKLNVDRSWVWDTNSAGFGGLISDPLLVLEHGLSNTWNQRFQSAEAMNAILCKNVNQTYMHLHAFKVYEIQLIVNRAWELSSSSNTFDRVWTTPLEAIL